MSPLPCIEIAPTTPTQRTIIWLHGLGADGSDFVSIVPELQLPADLGVKFIFPHAPIRPVTINNGYEMRAWYDILSLTIEGKIDQPGIEEASAAITALIENEIAQGIPSDRIVLAGFSQGAAMTLTTGIRYPKPLAGLLALSGYLPLAHATFDKATLANQRIPIFMAHGTEDPVVPYPLGAASYAVLKQARYPVSWHPYAMPHCVCAEEIHDISQWLKALFQPTEQ